ncbi:hypothetical protein [Bacillus aryabhattai]
MTKLMILVFMLISFLVHPQKMKAEENLTYFPVSDTGKVLKWKRVETLLPKGKKFKVIDVETGFYFYVQRRAGSHHADVQPLTRQDTKVMKHLYNGKWSWNRRAVLIPFKGQMLAASMNGMPHGAGALDNGFPGHFCIHFAGSTTHKSQNVDPGHQLMVLKAGGKLDEYALKAEPTEVVNMFLTGLKQDDDALMQPVLRVKQEHKLWAKLHSISTIYYKTDLFHAKKYKTKEKISVDCLIYYENKGAHKTTMVFTLKRNPLTNGWEISSLTL